MENPLQNDIWLVGQRASGKSAWLCEKYVELFQSGVSPNDILLLAMDEARARRLCLQILQRLIGISGGRIRSMGGFLADYAREVLAYRGDPLYPLRPASPWHLYHWLRNRLADDLKILTHHFFSIFEDWRKWNLTPSLLSRISLAERPRDKWHQLVALYGEYCSFHDESHFSDVIALAHRFSDDETEASFHPAYLLVDDVHELNAATWPVVSRLCQRAAFALAMLPEGQLFEEIENTRLRSITERAHKIIMKNQDEEPLVFQDRMAYLAKHADSNAHWILLRAVSPFEELLQGLLWARERSAEARVVIFLTSPMAQFGLLLEAAAWLDMKISLRGCFRSHWIPSLHRLGPSVNTTHGSETNGFSPASLWPAILLQGFLDDFKRVCGQEISLDSPVQRAEFQEALEQGLLKCEFDSNIRPNRGIEVTTLERPDLAIGAYAWIAGLSRESLPGSLPHNPVLPRYAAEELQVKLASAGHPVKLQAARSMSSLLRESQHKLLDVLARVNQDLLISCATKAGQNEPIAESPFFRAMTNLARGQRESAGACMECVDFIHPISFAKAESLPTASSTMRENLNLKPFLISATALAEFIQCPRKFFYAQILELEVPERPVAALIGLLLHEAMAHFLAPHKETKAPEAQIVGDWVHEFCLTHDEFKNLPEGMRVTIERFTARSLNEFFASETVWEGEVIGVEKSFELSLPTGFAIRGRIDRVDMTAEGMEVIDYKSSWSFASAKLKSEFLKAEEWIQLPIYVKAAEIHLEQKVAKISIIFFGLKSKDKPRRTTVRIMEGSRPASQTRGARDLVYGDEFGETWQRISHIVESIFQEGQSFDRGENPPCEDSFLGCPFVRICPVSKLSDEEQEENSL